MKIVVQFKSGPSKDFIIDDYYMSDDGYSLHLIVNDRIVGMINLCEIRFFYEDKID